MEYKKRIESHMIRIKFWNVHEINFKINFLMCFSINVKPRWLFKNYSKYSVYKIPAIKNQFNPETFGLNSFFCNLFTEKFQISFLFNWNFIHLLILVLLILHQKGNYFIIGWVVYNWLILGNHIFFSFLFVC